jgi:cytochrome c biogenesis protein CcdA/thiol-disulfide isomerase/thioredoxin
MLIFVLAYLGGVLTIVSPCILPVVPFVFARADRPFVQSGLPLLIGMALTFSAVATLAAVGGGWAVAANEYGRLAALLLLAFFGVVLLFPALWDHLSAPIVTLGGRLSDSATGSGQATEAGIGSSLVLGAATGLLWAPCAGPVLGLILTGAALQGASVRTSVLLMAYGAGAATSLALAILVGGRVFAAMKRSLGVSEWIRRGLGVAVLAAVVAIGLGVDTGFLTRVSLSSTTSLEQRLVDRFQKTPARESSASVAKGSPVVEGRLPALSGANQWLNSPPLTAEALRGKVVVVDFWTYSCINCLRSIPYVRAWAEKYGSQGLVVMGVHSPEFGFEKNVGNVQKAVKDLQISYPVAIDNDYALWRAFHNKYWPAHYFIDAEGRIRHHHFGEGSYDESERVIQTLLAEAGQAAVPGGVVTVKASGAEAASVQADVQSPETYIGYERSDRFISPDGSEDDAPKTYKRGQLRLNEWSLAGVWTIGPEQATLQQPGGAIVYRFHARDLHMVLCAAGGKPVRFRVTIDGAAPGEAHGSDVDAKGEGIVTEQRLYQLVRQPGQLIDRTFEIEFLDRGVQAYAFTFG